MVSAWSSTESGLDGRARSIRPDDGKNLIVGSYGWTYNIHIIESAQDFGDNNDDVGGNDGDNGEGDVDNMNELDAGIGYPRHHNPFLVKFIRLMF